MRHYTFERFIIKFFNDIKKEFPLSKLDKDMLIINYSHVEMSISLKKTYVEYKIAPTYKILLEQYIQTIKKMFSEYKFDINYSTVFPLLKHKDFVKDQPLNFIREDFTLDLDILYVCDMEEQFRFILKEDNADFDKIKEEAFKNLNTLINPLVKFNEDLDVYSLKFNSDYAATLLLSENVQKQIFKNLGDKFIFAVPTTTSLLVAKDTPYCKEILETLIDSDPDPNKITDRVYRYNKGHYSYVIDKNDIKLIK